MSLQDLTLIVRYLVVDSVRPLFGEELRLSRRSVPVNPQCGNTPDPGRRMHTYGLSTSITVPTP
jgi:hypothetical protein